MAKRHVFRAVFSVFMCIALLLPAAALAAQGDAIIARRDSGDFNDYIQSVFAMGDTLYLNGNSAIYTYKPGDADMVAWEWEFESEGADEEVAIPVVPEAQPREADSDGLVVGSEEGGLVIGGDDYGGDLIIGGADSSTSIIVGEGDLTIGEGESEAVIGGADGPTDIIVQETYYYRSRSYMFPCGGKIYSMVEVYESGEDVYRFDHMELEEVTLADGKATGTVINANLNWDDLTESYEEGYVYTQYVESVVCVGDMLCMITYDDITGMETLFVLDLVSGEMTRRPNAGVPYTMCAYEDGMLLIEEYSYEEPTRAAFKVYDPVQDTVQELVEVTVEEYSPYRGVLYSAEDKMIYFLEEGMIKSLDPATGEVAEVCDMPLSPYGSSNIALLEGGYYACADYEATVIRNLHPAQAPQTTLRIYDGSWSDCVTSAYYDFSNVNADTMVILSRDGISESQVLESMMNRDSSVDIYVLSVSGLAFEPLRERGYLYGLGASDALAQFGNTLFPKALEALSADGQIAALPVTIYGWSMGVNETAMAKLGISMDDVPDNWPAFLDFLIELPSYYTEDTEVTIFYPDTTQQDAYYYLFTAVIEEYMRYLNYSGEEFTFDTPLLRSLLEKLKQIDYGALGCPEEFNYEDGMMFDYSSDNILFETGCGHTIGNFYGDYSPLLLAMDEGAPVMLNVEMQVAFVNPFSENKEQAIAFMEMLAQRLPEDVLYNTSGCPM